MTAMTEKQKDDAFLAWAKANGDLMIPTGLPKVK